MQNKTKQIKLEIMEKKDKKKYYAAFSFLNVRPIFKSKLLEFFDFDVENAFWAEEKDLAQIREIYNISIRYPNRGEDEP